MIQNLGSSFFVPVECTSWIAVAEYAIVIGQPLVCVATIYSSKHLRIGAKALFASTRLREAMNRFSLRLINSRISHARSLLKPLVKAKGTGGKANKEDESVMASQKFLRTCLARSRISTVIRIGTFTD